MLSSILNGLQQLNTSNQPNALSFQKGKIFFGTVRNIYPNNFALLQIGIQNLIAKLEVPLTNGEAYWFQVDSDDGDIQLKLFTDKQSNGNDMSPILKQLSLPSTKENMELVHFLSKEQIPFTKEAVMKMSGWLSNNKDIKQNINIIKQMLEKGFPLTESIFKSLIAAEKKEPIHHQMQFLELSLLKEDPTPTVKEIQSTIYSIKNIQNKQLAISLIQTLINEKFSDNNNKMLSESILQKLSDETKSHPTDNNPKNQINAIQNRLEILKEEALISFPSIPQKLINNTVRFIDQYFSKELLHDFMPLTQQEKNFLIDSLNTMKQSINGQDFLPQLREATKSVGLFYEYQIASNLEEYHVVESLKPLLVKFLQESGHTPEARDLAEGLVNKMNGQQIQMYENGPLQQLYYEIPIQLFGFKTNLTMQWSGKKKEDGKIDPNYCHILFYLNLEHLHETIVEMKVQNRVINVNVYSESTVIKEAAAVIIPNLKNKLEELNYHLSAVHFMEKQSDFEKKIKINPKTVHQSYSGVDLRV